MFKLFSIFPFLKFLFPMFCFAAGADALGALGGGEAGGAVFEGGGEEDGGEGAEFGDGGEDGGESSGEEKREREGEESEESQKTEGRQRPSGKPMPELAKALSPEAKGALNKLKQEDPKAWKELSRRIWGLNNVEKELSEAFGDGGIQEAVQIKTNVDNFLEKTGYTDLGQVETEIIEYRAADGKILKGDVSFLNDLPEEIQSGIYNMMPDFIGQWAKRDVEGYERFFLPIVLATFAQSGGEDQLRYALYELNKMGLDNADVKSVHDKIKAVSDWLDTNKTKLKTAPDKRPPQQTEDPKTKERLARADQIEHREAIGRVGTQVNQQRGPAMTKALTAYFNGKIPPYVNRGEVLSRARLELAKLLGKSYSDKLDQYMGAKDEAGAIKFTLGQITDSRVQTAVERAAKYLYGQATLGSKPNNGNQPARRPNANGGEGNNRRPNAPGVSTIKYNPHSSSIDLALSDKWAKELGIPRNRLFLSNRAVLKGGKRVTWDKDAEPEQ